MAHSMATRSSALSSQFAGSAPGFVRGAAGVPDGAIGAGRRLDKSKAVRTDTRTTQLRESQRRHRQRKLNYIKSLEDRAKSADEAWRRVSELEAMCVTLQQELDEFRNPSSNHGSNIRHSQNHNNVSRVLDIDEACTMLCSIPAITNSSLVPQFFNLVQAQVDCNDVKLQRLFILRTLKVSSDILDLCGVVDRQKIYDIMMDFKKKNSSHEIYLNQMTTNFKFNPDDSASKSSLSSTLSPPSDLIIPEARADPANMDGIESLFRSSLKAIKSLQGASHLINDLCDVGRVMNRMKRYHSFRSLSKAVASEAMKKKRVRQDLYRSESEYKIMNAY
ncbi:hypothetical protein HK100_009381 [Physocladia obscura]|uniref:BZIP domain-containing protein n=1 Tax=Physocladia obscura TaxID=109957 RepID=A0AAD5T943_9FUNG|nr:hypothetical protein HK100_009381 [Physocladia obscura]